MITIDPAGLYSRSDLQELLRPFGIDADALIAKARPIKRMRLAWLGSDLLDALRALPPLGEQQPIASLPGSPRQSAGSRGKSKRKSAAVTGRTVGGMFSPEELGIDP